MVTDFYRNIRACLIEIDNDVVNKIISQWKQKFQATPANSGRVFIIGNGGSCAIAEHISTDLNKRCKVKAHTLSNNSLATCLANDYGYEHWVGKAIEFYADKGDMLIVISSSGMSKNMINACKVAKKMKLSSIITFSGFNADNPLRRLGDINLWLDSKAYNFVENIHQVWLLAIVDLLIGSREYSA